MKKKTLKWIISSACLVVLVGGGAWYYKTKEASPTATAYITGVVRQGNIEKSVNAIKNQADAVANVAPITSKQVQVVMGSQNTSTQLVGTTPSYASVRNQQATIGRFFTEKELQNNAEVAVVGTSVVQNLTGNANTNIVGQTINVNQVPFEVVGILQSKGSSGANNNDDQILVPISSAQLRLIGSKRLLLK